MPPERVEPPDADCHTLPNGECVAPNCRLHGPAETDAERDARFAPLNDATWGEGNWVRCPTCPHDYYDREVYHHKDAHGA